MKVKIHREGTNILIILFLIFGVMVALSWLFIRPAWIPIAFTSICGVVYLLVLNFFRSPRRTFPGSPQGLVVSSVDGRVVVVEEAYEPEYMRERMLQISVFMTVFNVHANWFPVEGRVEEVRYFPGRFYSAYLPKSSTENEHSSVLIRCDNGCRVVVNQVAGAVARRIVTYAEAGDDASVADHMGFIKFGSRVDIYMPLGTQPLVAVGDRTQGGITPIARLPHC